MLGLLLGDYRGRASAKACKLRRFWPPGPKNAKPNRLGPQKCETQSPRAPKMRNQISKMRNQSPKLRNQIPKLRNQIPKMRNQIASGPKNAKPNHLGPKNAKPNRLGPQPLNGLECPSLTGAKKALISFNFFNKKCNFQSRQGGDPFRGLGFLKNT